MNITYYYPWGYFHPVRSGAAAVASRHLDYFRSRGHRVRILVRGTDDRRAAFERHYHWVDDLAVLDLWRHRKIQRYFETWDFGSYLTAHTLIAACPQFNEWLAQPADVAFLNYVFATPLLDAIPASAYRMLETYDIISGQFVEHGGTTAKLQQLLSTEFDLYRLYDDVLMINQEEAEHARSRCSASLTYVARSVDLVPAGSGSLGEEYDLLFVGSDHKPNVEGATWFYEHVFEPLLKPKGLRWAICGSMCGRLQFNDSSVTGLGTVTDLPKVYRQSKVVIVPLLRGSGISIKTLEAMGHRKAVVSTPCGRRGLSAAADNALITRSESDPAGLADAIHALCVSDALRTDYGRRAAAYIAQHFSTNAYGRQMDRLFARAAARGSEALLDTRRFDSREAKPSAYQAAA